MTEIEIKPPAGAELILDIIDALAARQRELALSNVWVEHALHMGEHCLDKVLGPSRMKRMTVATALDLAELFGCRLVLTVDPELAAKMQARYEQCDYRKNHPPRRLSRKLMELAKPLVHKAMSASGGRARAASIPATLASRIGRKAGRARMQSMTKAQRSELASLAAKARWKVHGVAAETAAGVAP